MVLTHELINGFQSVPAPSSPPPSIKFPAKQFLTAPLFQRAGAVQLYALLMVLKRSPSNSTFPVRVFPLDDNLSSAVMPVFVDPAIVRVLPTSFDRSCVQSYTWSKLVVKQVSRKQGGCKHHDTRIERKARRTVVRNVPFCRSTGFV